MRAAASRNCSRARRRRDATLPSGICSSSAISGEVRPFELVEHEHLDQIGVDLGQHEIAKLRVGALVAGVAVDGEALIHVFVQLPAYGLAAERVRDAQGGRDQKRSFAFRADVVQPLGGKQERLLGRVFGGLG